MRYSSYSTAIAALLVAGCTATSTPQRPTDTDPTQPTASSTAPATVVPILRPAQDSDLAGVIIPVRDRYDLARRFRGISQPDVVPPTTGFKVGDSTKFWVQNTTENASVEITAHLVAAGQHIAMWVEDGNVLDASALQESVDRFDRETYETNRSIFGSEALPGIDGDPRIHVLHTSQLGGGVAGYFYSPSEYPINVVPFSNQKDLVYISVDALTPGSPEYDAVLAHEFQHMIHWSTDSNEETWMNEGLSEVASTQNGFGLSGFAGTFMEDPNLQLTAWSESGGNAPHYGAAYLFNMYFLDRFGAEALVKLVAHQENGLTSVDSTLAEIGAGVTADDLFEDWLVANLLNDLSVGSGHYGYHNLPRIGLLEIRDVIDQPVSDEPFQAYQYGGRYITVSLPGAVRIDFQGHPVTRILPTNTQRNGGSMVWWSNRADNSNTSLTRELDLTSVTQAELTFDLWYQLEDAWDYGHVAISADGGSSWTILEGRYSSDVNPHGNAYGLSYTGQSASQSDADAGGWLSESIELSAYAGKKILLSFEMITDDAVNQPGMALDNICVEAIGWCDDVEQPEDGWIAAGFTRINNVLPQLYSVQIVSTGSDGSLQVTPLALDESNAGTFEATINPQTPLILIVSGLTRFVTEQAPFTLTVQPVSP